MWHWGSHTGSFLPTPLTYWTLLILNFLHQVSVSVWSLRLRTTSLYFPGYFLLFGSSSQSLGSFVGELTYPLGIRGPHKEFFHFHFFLNQKNNEDTNNDYISLYNNAIMTCNFKFFLWRKRPTEAKVPRVKENHNATLLYRGNSNSHTFYFFLPTTPCFQKWHREENLRKF